MTVKELIDNLKTMDLNEQVYVHNAKGYSKISKIEYIDSDNKKSVHIT